MSEPYLVNSTTSCTITCAAADVRLDSCYTAEGSYPETLTECVCLQDNTPSLFIGVFDQCTICNTNDIGENQLGLYQDWDVICRVYATGGPASAEYVATAISTTALHSSWSRAIVPILQAELSATAQILSLNGGNAVQATGSSYTPPALASVTSTGILTPVLPSSVAAGSGPGGVAAATTAVKSQPGGGVQGVAGGTGTGGTTTGVAGAANPTGAAGSTGSGGQQGSSTFGKPGAASGLNIPAGLWVLGLTGLVAGGAFLL